jgi:hypothetical protein
VGIPGKYRFFIAMDDIAVTKKGKPVENIIIKIIFLPE